MEVLAEKDHGFKSLKEVVSNYDGSSGSKAFRQQGDIEMLDER